MAKHLPDYHAPLLALGKKLLLWTILPAVILTAVYVLGWKSPSPQEKA